MAEKATVLLPDRFQEGKLRKQRRMHGTQKVVAQGAGVSAGTISRAERGFAVNFTSAILIGLELGLLDYGVYDIRDRRIKRVLRYMRVVQRGGHAKGWNDYYAGVRKLLNAA